jgi:lipid A 3-O-deacylase
MLINLFHVVSPNIRRVKKSCILCAETVLWMLVMGLFPAAAWSQDSHELPLKTFTLYWENDTFNGTDQDYSNGVKMTWSQPYKSAASGQRGFQEWVFKHLPFSRNSSPSKATDFSIGQFIYTPKDTARSDLIVNDRPYAGYSFLDYGFISKSGNRRDVWEFEIGVVGPWSLAENTQNVVHDLIGSSRARGWDHQLENELGLEAIYEAKWQLGHLSSRQGFGVDLIPHLGAQAGNIATSVKAGAELRFGWLIPRDFGSCPIRAGCDAGDVLNYGLKGWNSQKRLGIHFFAAVEGRLVLRDIFLDGNTFKSSHSVDKEIYVADLIGGIALTYGQIKVNYALVLRTPEFKQRKDNHAFGAINISYAY